MPIRRDGAAEHLLQTHGLRAQLQFIREVLLGLAHLVLHRFGPPPPLLALERDAVRIGMELHHVAFPRDPQRMGDHGEAAKDQQIAPALAKRLVVGAAVHQAALHRAPVSYTHLDVYKRQPMSSGIRFAQTCSGWESIPRPSRRSWGTQISQRRLTSIRTWKRKCSANKSEDWETAYHLLGRDTRRLERCLGCLTKKERGMAIHSLHPRVHHLHHILHHLRVEIWTEMEGCVNNDI